MAKAARPIQTGFSAIRRSKIARAGMVSFLLATAAAVFTAATPIAAGAVTYWSAPSNVDSSNVIQSVSCASPLFCVAGDNAGNVITYNGSTWSAPDQIAAGGDLYLSCPTATFCVAVGEGGSENTWDGSSWSATGPIGSEVSDMTSVSCTSANFCAAVDVDGGADIWNGTSWTGPTSIDPGNSLNSVSCVGSTFCVAVDDEGNSATWNGTSWSGLTDIDSPDSLTSVSCTSSTFCADVDNAGEAGTYDGSGWTGGGIDGSNVLEGVSCASPAFCMAVDAVGNALEYNGSSWSAPTSIDGTEITAVSCPTTSFCVATDDAGSVMTYAPPTSPTQIDWSAPLDVDGSGELTSVSCAGTQFCSAVDNGAGVVTYNGSSWSSPMYLTEGQDYGISCPSTTFCVAVGSGGAEETWNGGSWGGPTPTGSDTNVLNSVSCTSSQFCITVDSDGGYDSWNGTSWTGPTSVDPGKSLTSVSCVSSTFCVAVDTAGSVETWNGTGWAGPASVDPGKVLTSVTCASTSFCVAVDYKGNAFLYDGVSWDGGTNIDGITDLRSVSCANTAFCVAGDTNGNVLTYNGSSWSLVNIDDNVITSVDCPTKSFCAATDDAGYAMTYGWVSASYSCNFPGLGPTTTPVLLSEAPSPPPSIAAPGTFQTTLSAQVTIPSAAVNNALGDGASSITIGSQTTETDALTLSDAPSSSVNPNTLTTSATNLPITFAPQSNTPYTYPTTYNPETWQTVNVPGTVDFTPGPIDLTLTYLISGTPSPESVTCTPPGGVTELDSTVVSSPGGTPSIQVPRSVPPLQSQVSAPLDAGWAVEIANTSTANVTGLSAAITVQGGSGTLTYDLAGMSDTGTSCSSSGPNAATCNVGTLAGGTTKTLNVLVLTTGLAQGTSITGSANVTSTNASSHVSSLTGVNVVVVPQGVDAVAVPNVSLASSSKNPSHKLLAKTTLRLPSKIPAAGPFEGPLVRVQGPPVSVTLVALAGSQDPELCPPASGGCEGDVVEMEGNFAPYTSTATPISAVIEIYYGSSVPSGHMYFQSSAGATPSLIPACVKTGGHYNTPCVDGPQQIIGTAGKKSTEDTIFFTGTDPLVGRR